MRKESESRMLIKRVSMGESVALSIVKAIVRRRNQSHPGVLIYKTQFSWVRVVSLRVHEAQESSVSEHQVDQLFYEMDVNTERTLDRTVSCSLSIISAVVVRDRCFPSSIIMTY